MYIWNDTKRFRKITETTRICHQSRILQYWLAKQSAQTAPTTSRQVHSCLLSSTHPPDKKILWELATVGQQHHPLQRSILPQMDARSHEPQEELSWSFHSVAPAHLCSTDISARPAPRTHFSCVKFSLTHPCGAFCWRLSHLRWFLLSLFSVSSLMAFAWACPPHPSVLSTWRRILYTS